MVASTLVDRCRSLEIGEALDIEEKLRIFPLLAKSGTEPVYRLLDKDAPPGLEVTEVSQTGSVPNLRVQNGTDSMVLLIDGQELIGAKQNRILNVDVLVPAHSTIDIPVSCVEAGRWSYRQRAFASGGWSSSSMRAAKSSSVFRAMQARAASYRSDQAEVWDHVGRLHMALGSSSGTAAMADAYAHKAVDLAALRQRARLPHGAVGFAVYDGGEFLGLDLFDRATTLEHVWERLLDGYLLDWIAYCKGRPVQGVVEQPPHEVLAAIAEGTWQSFDSPGAGRDVRLESESLVGSGLVWDDRSLVHLQVFPSARKAPQSDRPSADTQPFVRGREREGVPSRQVETPAGPAAGLRCPGCGFIYATVRVGDEIVCGHCGRRSQAVSR